MKVKIFKENFYDMLEDNINNFIKDNQIKIIDIKYNHIFAPSGAHHYSTLIIYEEI